MGTGSILIKIFANHISDGGLLSRMCVELSKLNDKKKSSKKVGKRHKERTANEHRKGYSVSLAIRKMQIGTTLRYHCILIRIAKIKKKNGDTKSCEGWMHKNWISHALLLGVWSGKGTLEELGSKKKNLNIHLPYTPATVFWGVYPREVKTYDHPKMCTHC